MASQSSNNQTWPFADFDLAELRRFPPDLFPLSGSDDLAALVLSLALAFNDINSLYWFTKQLERCAPPDAAAIGAGEGQWNGMQLVTARFSLGLMHEVLRAIGAAHHKGTLRTPMARQLIKLFSKREREQWKSVVDAARGVSKHGPLQKYPCRDAQ